MFILFETEIPNNVPQYMYVPINNTSENTKDSETSGMATSGENDLVDYEQGPPGAGPPPEGFEEPPEGIGGEEEQQIQQEIEPLKKLYLLQKLNKLNDALKDWIE